MSFQCSLRLLSKWKGWDHIKGLTKGGGAIHVRHTLGSKGRYKRHSTLYGIRDGRRHQTNHMRGGLGIKLGGGLFGLRIPRQHALSNMTKEQYEVEVFGHPNITNPYRHMMDEHPDVEGVVENSALRATFVFALPPAPLLQQPSSSRSSLGAAITEHSTERLLPRAWREVLPSIVRVATTLEKSYNVPHLENDTHHHHNNLICSSSSSSPQPVSRFSIPEAVRIVLATKSSSIALTFDHTDRSSNSKSTADCEKEVTRKELLKALIMLHHEASSVGGAKAFPPLRAPHSAGVATQYDNKPRRRLFGDALLSTSAVSSPSSPPKSSSSSLRSDVALEHVGVDGWLHRLKEIEPNALSLRTVQPISWSSSRVKVAPVYIPSGDAKYDAEDANALLRWYFYNNDPRAHFSDLIPHSGRPFHCHVLVECMCPDMTTDGEEGEGIMRFKGFLGARTVKALSEYGYRISAATAEELVGVLVGWSCRTRLMDNHQPNLHEDAKSGDCGGHVEPSAV